MKIEEVKGKVKRCLVLTSILAYLLPAYCFSQDWKSKTDSLIPLVEKATSDTQRLNLLYTISELATRNDATLSMKYAKEMEDLANKTGNKAFLGQAYYLLGCNYDDIQSFPDAMEYYYKAQELLEESKDTVILMRVYNQIGILYSYQKKYEDALKYFEKFASLLENSKDEKKLANCYNNIGVVYKNLKRTDLANEFYFKALEIFTRINYEKGIASAYLNIGVLLTNEGKHKEGQEYNRDALKIFRSKDNTFGVITALSNIADSYLTTNDLKLSEQYLDTARILSLEDDDSFHLQMIYEGYSKLYRKKGDYKNALEYFDKFIALKDSMFVSESAQTTADLEARHNMLKTEKELELFKKNEEINALQLTRSRTFLAILILGILSIAIIAFLLLQRNKAKQLVNDTLHKQNEEILIQKTEITDSINYAKRIQESILPPERLIKAVLPDSFVFYLPKDIVSGDFYWADKKEGRSYFAAVDCTGHGVPGAMMSVLGFNLIQQALNDKNLSTPAEILKHLDNGVNMTLRQSGTENTVSDGMDLAICCIDWQKMELQYAGAYNALWVLKKDSIDILEIKADKKIVGSNENDVADEFTNHRLSLQRGDLVFILSDGYADQFGGPRGKKFKYKPMKELLVSIRGKDMAEQRNILEQNILSWQGDQEQVDDMLVIGVRI